MPVQREASNTPTLLENPRLVKHGVGEQGKYSPYCLCCILYYLFRVLLHRCFQAIMDTDGKFSKILAVEFCSRLNQLHNSSNDDLAKSKLLQFGFSLGKHTYE